MNRDFETKKQILLNLLQTLGLAGDHPTQSDRVVDRSSQDSVRESNQAPPSLLQEDFLLKPGEIPAVQDRFHALLKRRLQLEAQRRPPLFPWEKEVMEYGAEAARATSPMIAATSVWMTQLRDLQLPVPMPESVLTELLTRCQAIVTSSLREGAKLVKAVDTLFPGQAQLLNDVAGYVMVSPARSSAASLQELAAQAGIEFPNDYEDAIDTQQMALSLLAAREIMGSLTLTVSPKHPEIEREWLTELGVLTLRTHYHTGGSGVNQSTVDQETVHLQIDADLPCGGSLQFQGKEFRSLANRDNAGCLSLEIHDFAADGIYPLEVRLGEHDRLMFAIHPVSQG
jgi:hypothetical protein